MKFSCALPVDDVGENGFLSIEGMSNAVEAIDQARLDAVYLTDHPAPSDRWLSSGGHATLDPFVALAVAAGASNRLRLHMHILVLAYRNPVIVAKSLATLDRLSGGRLTVGIGTGYLKSEYAAVGVPFEERGARTDEALDLMRQAFTGAPVNFEGQHFVARDNVVRPTPAQAPLPVWGGGNAPRAIRRAVEKCQGWSPFPSSETVSRSARTESLTSLPQLRDKIGYARDLAESLGRTEPLDICVSSFQRVSAIIDTRDRGEAGKLVDEYSAFAEAGVSWTTVAVSCPSPGAFAENVQWFGEEVAAKVRGR